MATLLFQFLDFCELDLTKVPDDKSCTEELKKWHAPKKLENKGAVIFEDLIFPQDSYEKDKQGKKRPAVQLIIQPVLNLRRTQGHKAKAINGLNTESAITFG